MAPTGRPPIELWLRFREVQAKGRGYQSAAPNDYWTPPDKSSKFMSADENPPWIRWSPGQVEENCEPPPSAIKHGTGSLFWTSCRHAFMYAPYDCIKKDVAQSRSTARGWDRLSFEKVEHSSYPNLWKAGHQLGKRQISCCMTDGWENLLGPAYFSDSLFSNNGGRTCCLAGDLALIFGLLAFTAGPGHIVDALRQATRSVPIVDGIGCAMEYVPAARRCGGGSVHKGRKDRRGLVVDVCYDGANAGSGRRIHDWERGALGAILVDSQERTIAAAQATPASPHRPLVSPTGRTVPRPIPVQVPYAVHPNHYMRQQ